MTGVEMTDHATDRETRPARRIGADGDGHAG